MVVYKGKEFKVGVERDAKKGDILRRIKETIGLNLNSRIELSDGNGEKVEVNS